MSEKKVNDSGSALIRDVILGGQDGLVNVLGVVLAVATATQSKYVILVSGLAATFAESISMAAVAYTSAKAGKEFYDKRERELLHLANFKPKLAKQEVKNVLRTSGLEGTFLNKAVSHILDNKKRILKNLNLGARSAEFDHPIRDAVVVGLAALAGSFVPLLAFLGPFFISIPTAIWFTLALSTAVLFVSGAYKGHLTGVQPFKSGVEMAVVGMTAALVGYGIGAALGALPLA